uniref:Uncharacterized protein n=1 Tax=Micrurus carvalhoi TaxID=3147026 RepID=A0A2H6N5G3_9SAUR
MHHKLMTNWNNVFNILVKQSKILKEMTSISAASLSGRTGKKPTPATATPMITQKKPEEIQMAEKPNPMVNTQTICIRYYTGNDIETSGDDDEASCRDESRYK